jgi:hypothetical protein
MERLTKKDIDEIKYLRGVFKRFSKKYPFITFQDFQMEIESDEFDPLTFHLNLSEKNRKLKIAKDELERAFTPRIKRMLKETIEMEE